MDTTNSFINSLPPVLRVQELADILDISRDTLYRMIHANKIKAIRIGRSDYRITRDAVSEYLAGAAISPSQPVNDTENIAEPNEPNLNDEQPLLCVEDLMPILGISRNTAYDIVRSGQIRSVIVGKNRYRITRAALAEYLTNASQYQNREGKV